MSKEIFDQDTSFITARTPLESLPVASLFFTHGERVGQEVPLSSHTFFIGRSRNNNLIFNDKSVSRKHAVINFLDGEYIINDLNSLKGVYVNGKKVDEAVLRPGDIINIGENRMQFRLISPSGHWIVPGRRSSIWFVFVALILGVVIGVATWFFVQKYYRGQFPKEVMTKIELHYTRGVELFNKEHDIEGARREWKKIMELDPMMKTDYSIKASKLLMNTEPKGPSE